MKIDYDRSLNAGQLEVVKNGEGYCLVLAGAGSGKTRTLVYRVAYLLENGVSPKELLLLTFTIKAAKEMLSRVESLLGNSLSGMWGGTFHHVCNRILRKFAPRLGLSQNYIILDDEDSKALFAQCIRDVNSDKSVKGFPSAGFFSYLRGISINTLQPWEDILRNMFEEFTQFYFPIKQVFEMYEKRKQEGGLVDFDDLLLLTYRMLRSDKEIRDYYARRFKYVLVDEYQDTSSLQAEIVELLSSHYRNLMVVGDDAQSIYSFRGATIENILNFPKRHPDAKVFYLNQNYRSTPEVIYLANCTIENNQRAFKKQLKAVTIDSGELPLVASFGSAEDEARFIADQIGLFLDEGISANQIAVLFRASYHSAKLELSLASRGIGYIMRGGVRFFEQAHIKDVIAYLRVLYNPKDYMAWQRLLCLYPGIGPQTAKKLYLLLRDMDLFDITTEGLPRVSGKAKGSLRKIVNIFSSIKNLSLSEACRYILEEGYWDYLRENFDDYTQRQEDLIYLLDFLKGYQDLETLFSDIGLNENFKKELGGTDSVILSTVHQAKGLEWEVVFVMGVIDGQFPHAKSLREEGGIEEERRLFYVALTRAKRHLIITSPTMSFDYRFGGYVPKRSTFIEELPKDGYKEFCVGGINPTPIWEKDWFSSH